MLSLSIVLKMWNNIIKFKSITHHQILDSFYYTLLAILMLFCNIVRPQKLEDHKVVLHPCKLCNFWKMICWTQEYDLFRDRLIFLKFVFAWAVWQTPNARLFKKDKLHLIGHFLSGHHLQCFQKNLAITHPILLFNLPDNFRVNFSASLVTLSMKHFIKTAFRDWTVWKPGKVQR